MSISVPSSVTTTMASLPGRTALTPAVRRRWASLKPPRSACRMPLGLDTVQLSGAKMARAKGPVSAGAIWRASATVISR